jgi:hypothetical protein
MLAAEHYGQRAEECRALAFQSNADHERAAILKLAEQWDRLARNEGEERDLS